MSFHTTYSTEPRQVCTTHAILDNGVGAVVLCRAHVFNLLKLGSFTNMHVWDFLPGSG